ncbi:Golgi to ER traffic protein 4-like protein [Armadillidium nasatum]|uniref:Golgi to ER traffic protein 4-like protein n=1 Tax=Armadillidium nasatum TaxID=96803 RepID=A0A5N5TG10_9CRUS|nr:Golgi to ER traffic protein 4-like protein [Armadillidium nasatum]
MSQGSRGIARVLAKLKASIDDGKFYEAHQMYRTLYFRYLGQKKYQEVLQLLYEGASLLLAHDQQTSGADLALLMLDVLEKSNSVPNEENISKIAKLFELLSCSTPERHQYLVKAVKWSAGELFNLGHPKLHENLARILWKEKNYACARYHYIRSCDGSGCATMLVELHLLRGYPSEVDLFLAQAVFQYLCLQKKVEASDAFQTYTAKHPTIKDQRGPPFLLPLLNFLWLLLSAVESGKVTQFTILCEQYRPTLKRDPMYVEYLDKIGNLLHGLLGGLEEDSDDDMTQQASSSRHQPMSSEELD